jgi:hypothetical protein
MIHLFFLVLACVLFLLAGFGVSPQPPSRYNLVWFGLAALTLSELLPLIFGGR